MAKIGGRFGEGLSGLVGNLVLYSYRGQQCIRTRPWKRSKNSWSERQKSSWKRFTAIKAFWSRFNYSPIQGIWKVAEKGKRGDNLFVSVNMPAFGYDGSIIDPERLHFSAGQLPLPFRLMAARSQSDPNKIEVTWQNDSASGMAWDDDQLIMMVGYGQEFKGPIETGALRKKESAEIELPAVPGTIDKIWLFFASEERKLYSPDQYFGI
jgi:hypothetical protein